MTMRMVLGLLFCVAAAAAPLRLLESARVSDRREVWLREEMSYERCLSRARATLGTLRPGWALARIVMGRSVRSIQRHAGFELPTGHGYGDYEEANRLYGPDREPLAELLATPAGWVFSYVEGDQVRREAQGEAGGVVVRGRRFELLGFRLVRLRRVSAQPRKEFSITLYFRGEVGGAGPRDLMEEMARRVDDAQAEVQVRPDPWFFCEAGFANPYRFESGTTTPGRQAWAAIPVTRCSKATGPATCRTAEGGR